jgi:hypothetical protein
MALGARERTVLLFSFECQCATVDWGVLGSFGNHVFLKRSDGLGPGEKEKVMT